MTSSQSELADKARSLFASNKLTALHYFWWVALGMLMTGASLFSLLVTYLHLGVTGVAHLIHGQYVQFRDLFFDNLELVIPFHMKADSRAFILAFLMFAAVFVRTHAVIRKDGWTLNSLLIFGVLVPAVIMLGAVMFALVVIALVSGQLDFFASRDASDVWVFYGVILCVIAMDSVEGLSEAFLTLALNVAGSVVVALVLLALGGAL